MPPNVAIVVADFYQDLSNELLAGVEGVLQNIDIKADRFFVMGALEIPPAIAQLEKKYDIYIALGAVVRGETSHYDIVAGESARGLMDLAIQKKMMIGNGIITVDTMAQAVARVDRQNGNKGGFATAAVLRLWLLSKK
ncbi:MAG: 6,7-dimethyl-8-ribityllumazine synthase [Alphaproteobacteria bacterium]